MELVTFFALAAVSIISALFVVLQRRAIYSALSLIVCLGSMAVLFFQLGAQFVGAVQIIVYAGAIMVLFLFVVMLLDPASELFAPNRFRLLIPTAVVLAVIAGYILVRTALTWSQAAPGVVTTSGPVENTRNIAQMLFHDYLLPFEVTSILILAAVIGAVVLSKRPN